MTVTILAVWLIATNSNYASPNLVTPGANGRYTPYIEEFTGPDPMAACKATKKAIYKQINNEHALVCVVRSVKVGLAP